MPAWVFVPSENRTDEDRRRRSAAVAEITTLGHLPVTYEGQPGRALREGEDPLDRCRALVRESDVLLRARFSDRSGAPIGPVATDDL